MTLATEPLVLPLRADETGVVQVSGTTIGLEAVVSLYNQGLTAEEIVRAYPAIPLPDVHAVLAYYLRHRAEVDAYVEEIIRRYERLRADYEARFPPGGPTKAELLARWQQRDEASHP